MKKNKPKINRNIPKYSNGGFNKFGNALKDIGYGAADMTLSGVGMGNKIDEQYSTEAGQQFNQKLNQAQPMITGISDAIPIWGQVAKAGRSAGSQFNPEYQGSIEEQQLQQQPIIAKDGGQYNPYAKSLKPFNAQIEKQENAVDRMGNFTQFNASSHEAQNNQFIPDGNVNLTAGTKIFSDSLKDKATGKTFAKLNNVNKPSDKDHPFTAEFKLKNSERIFQSQEQLKQDKVANYAKRMGLDNYAPKFANGGIKQYTGGGSHIGDTAYGSYVNGNWEAFPTYAQSTPEGTFDAKGEMTALPYGKQYIKPMESKDINPFTEEPEKFNPMYKDESSPGYNYKSFTETAKEPKDYSNITSNLAGLASLAGPVAGLINNKKLPPVNFETPGYLSYDPSSEMRQNAMAAKFERTMLNDKVGGNGGAYLANIGQIGARAAERDAKTLRDSYNINAQGFNQNQRDVTAIRNTQTDYRRKDEAGYRDKNENNINEIGMGIAQLSKDNKNTNSDYQTLGMISKMYPNYEYNKKTGEWVHRQNKSKLSQEDISKIYKTTTV